MRWSTAATPTTTRWCTSGASITSWADLTACADPRILTTERLILRPHTLEDFADNAAMWGDEQVTRQIGGRPFTPEEVCASDLSGEATKRR
ncbi:GNAT family N-acetyltransferase [Deinococcus sp.]|uniref:GNAT family N-acetyltransferase n=1 Tax=Deinococcus sp. TaxID=47478 RepID=UPI003CC56C01